MITKYTINDYGSYVFGGDRNGGNYSYHELFYVNEKGEILSGEYWNSSDYPSCEFCGWFGHRCGCTEYLPSPLAISIARNGLENIEKLDGVEVEVEPVEI